MRFGVLSLEDPAILAAQLLLLLAPFVWWIL